MREIRTSGLMRGSDGNGDSRPLLPTLLPPCEKINLLVVYRRGGPNRWNIGRSGTGFLIKSVVRGSGFFFCTCLA